MPMRTIRIAAVVLGLPLLSGCTYRRTIFSRDPAAVPAPAHTFTVIRSVVYFPMVGHEWDLDLTIPSERVRPGEEVVFPSPGVSASWFEAFEAGRRTATPIGRIRFRRVLPGRVEAEVDLRNPGRTGDWRLRRRMWFRYQEARAQGADRAIPGTPNRPGGAR
jgi:hypothetical protein